MIVCKHIASGSNCPTERADRALYLGRIRFQCEKLNFL